MSFSEWVPKVVFVTLALFSISSHAFSNIETSGFATLGVSRSDSSIVYRGFIDRDLDYNLTTRAGVNFSREFSDSTSGRIQFIARGLDEDFETRVNIAQVEWNASSNTTFRAGRIRIPLYFYSDFQDVGDAYVWNQLPVEVYGVTPVDSIIGLSGLYSKSFGQLQLDFELIGGGGQSEFINQGRTQTIDTNDFYGANFRVGLQGFDLRFAYYVAGRVDTEVLTETDTVVSGSIFNRSFSVIKSTIDNITVFSAGLRYNSRRLFVVYERASINSNEAIIDFYDVYYASFGAKFSEGRRIVYVTFSEVADVVSSTLSGQRTLSLGFTQRVNASFSAKLELYRVSTHFDNKTAGQFASAPNRDVNAAGISINYAF